MLSPAITVSLSGPMAQHSSGVSVVQRAISRPLVTFHNRSVQSSDALSACRPSGLNVQAFTSAVCPSKDCIIAPLVTFHRSKSLPALNTCRPSGLNAHLLRCALLLSLKMRTSAPLATSNNRRVPSFDPYNTCCPLGLNVPPEISPDDT